MRVLVTGSLGLLGSTIASRFAMNGADVVSSVHSEPPDTDPGFQANWRVMDLRDTDSVDAVIHECEPDWVVNCAAMTDVDACEATQSAAFDINAKGPQRIARAASEVDARVCQISTDYVFGNDETSPHEHTEELSPIQIYGRSKAEGERLVKRESESPIIARVSFLYGINAVTDQSVGLVPWILSKSENETIPLYTDQRVSPTYASHAAQTITSLTESGESGVFHCNNSGCVTPYELGEHVLDEAGRGSDALIESTLADANRSAPRPVSSCLSTKHTDAVLSRPQPSWRAGVESFLDDV